MTLLDPPIPKMLATFSTLTTSLTMGAGTAAGAGDLAGTTVRTGAGAGTTLRTGAGAGLATTTRRMGAGLGAGWGITARATGRARIWTKLG